MDINELFAQYQTDPQTGLSPAAVTWHREQYGANRLPEDRSIHWGKMLIEEIRDPLVMILLAATLISGLLGEWLDAGIMIAVVLINACIGLIQKVKAKRSLDSLKQMNIPVCQCLRDGSWQTVETSELVVGDIVAIRAGMFVPADMIVFDTVALKVDESALTGESMNVDKPDQSKVYMSTIITYGKALGLVEAVGLETEIGKIAAVLHDHQQERTPLQKRMTELSEKLGILAMLVCLAMFIVGVIQGRAFFDMLLLAISLAVAAIPEGLVAVVSIVLALGTTKMAKHHVIVRHLHAIETLGCVSYICSDKTGTLTQNEMQVLDTFSFQDNGRLARGMILCNNVQAIEGTLVGEATEKALMTYFLQYEDLSDLQKVYPRVREVPFDSEKKMMEVVVLEDDHYVAYQKGAVEVLLPKCDRLLEQGTVTMMSEEQYQAIVEAENRMTSQGLRVLMLGYQPITNLQTQIQKMIFVGLVGMADPCRPEAKQAIARARQAGVEVTMVTGDHPDTAFAIARELQLTVNARQVMTSDELATLSDAALNRRIETIRVFARAKPQDKVRIVETLKKRGYIVAMTGDGVNDAPALKKAQVGIAMGQGTDVAKDAADMILVDDHFETIVESIAQGRQVYLNIRQTIWYLLSCNFGEIITLFGGILLLDRSCTILTPVMILWVNLVTDALPALCLGIMPSSDRLMEVPPRSPNESLFSQGGYLFTIVNGGLIGLITLVSYRYGLSFSPLQASTIALMVLSLAQLAHTFNFISNQKGLLQIDWKPYRLVFAVVTGLAVLEVAVAQLPVFNWLLKTTPLDIWQWGVVIGLSLCPIIYNELVKWFSH